MRSGGPRLSTVVAAEPARRVRPLRLRVHSALRWLHVYISMAMLLLVLFFSITGITLNHPDWLAAERTDEYSGQLPASWRTAQGVDWLVVAEQLRREHGVRGTVADRTADASQGALTFRAPGYSADAYIDMSDGSYQLTVVYQGALGVLNDLHRGRDAGGSWAWLIDLSGVFLVLLSLTGLGLLWYLRKMRLTGLLTMVGGCVLLVVLAMMAGTMS